jgi:hypothetical protein
MLVSVMDNFELHLNGRQIQIKRSVPYWNICVFIYILSNKNEVTFSPATVSNVPLSPQSVQQRKKIESVDLHRQDEEETVDKSLTFIDSNLSNPENKKFVTFSYFVVLFLLAF